MGTNTANRKYLAEGAPQGLMTPDQVATYLGCGRTFAYELLRTGEIASLKVGRLRRVRREDVDEYVRTRLDEQRR